MNTIRLLTFATADFRHAQTVLNKSAINVGIDSLTLWNERRLAKEPIFNSPIFRHKRGFGCWLWKPYLIHYELSRLNDGEILIYADCGRPFPNRFEKSPQPLINWALQYNDGIWPGVYIPQAGPNLAWTKRDCFIAMNCDSPKYWKHPQIQASPLIFEKNPKSMFLVEEWLSWCMHSNIITDDPSKRGPNHDGFIAHRHDQSIWTNIVIKRGVRCYGSLNFIMPDPKDINNWIDKLLGNEDEIMRRYNYKSIKWSLRAKYDRLLRLKDLAFPGK